MQINLVKQYRVWKTVWVSKWDALRGGFIGAFVGLLPNFGGVQCQIDGSYGSTVAAHPNEKFGDGNIKGVIGPEGANNAQKVNNVNDSHCVVWYSQRTICNCDHGHCLCIWGLN